MANNKTAINGIDVSECRYLNKVVNEEPYCNADEEHLYTCSSDENCYFKQFKRLQKENEKLKADLKGETEQCQKWYQLETDKHFQMLKYEQALEKIRKEYTNSIFYQCDKTEEECPCHNCIILGQLDRVQNIVKIIDEVLNDRN